MDKADITIIGAGVVGLAVAARLAGTDKTCVILEKNPKFGQETSSRNSEVIHSGIYYPPGSLKAVLCVKGNPLLYEFAKTYGIKHQNTTKLVVAVSDPEIKDIEKLMQNGINNGVEGLKIISGKEVSALEPEVKAKAALFVPSTGIIDTHTLMQRLAGQAQEKGALISYNSQVTGIEKLTDFYRIYVNNEPALDSSIIINCAGLESDKIASFAGLDPEKEGFKLYPCKGSYFRTSQRFAIKRLIYPVPSHNVNNLGIHLTLDLAGSVRFGPDAEYVCTMDYDVTDKQKQGFFNSISRYIPSVKLESLYPDTSGIRPKIQGPDGPFKDFIIRNEASRGLAGFINLIGIESPGLTSCLSIAEYAANLL